MSEIKPALTAKEWADRLLTSPTEVVWDAHSVLIGSIYDGADYEFSGDTRRALAVVTLHEQHFGFTWADVDLLRSAADEAQDSARPLTPEGQASARAPYDSLAERIAALLPPRES